MDLQSFRAQALAKGFDEVLERRWPPDSDTGTHSHPFAVEALVVEGEMWLQQGPLAVRLLPGCEFTLDADVPHSERYGPRGAVYYAARRNVR